MNPVVADVPEQALIDQYLTELVQLSPNARLELIARLSLTLKSKLPTAESVPVSTLLPDFVGAWADDVEADKMEAAIRSSRHFSAKPELAQWH